MAESEALLAQLEPLVAERHLMLLAGFVTGKHLVLLVSVAELVKLAQLLVSDLLAETLVHPVLLVSDLQQLGQ